MISCGSILSGPAVFGSDPEASVPFINLLITDRALIWYNMDAIFQVLDAWTYLNPDKKHRDGIMDYNLIYIHYLCRSNIYYIAYGAKKNISQCTYTGEKIN